MVVSQNHTKSIRKALLGQRAQVPLCLALLALPDANSVGPAAAMDAVDAVTLLAEAYSDFDFLSEKPRFAAHFAMGMEADFRRQEQQLLQRTDGSYLSTSNPDGTVTVSAQDRQQMVAAMVSALLQSIAHSLNLSP